jgi:pSer/pThr/pTyr-binding forkhead associated (FHA) protein
MSGPQSLSGQQQGKASSRRKAANVRGKPPKARSRRRAKPPEMPAPAFAAIDLDTPAPPPAPNYQPPSPAPRQLADATEQPEPSKQVAATASGDAVPEAATVQAVGSQTPTLMFDNGDKLAVGGEAVLGRAPTPNERQLAVVVNDPTRTVSKTHLSFGLRNGQLWVADLGSTNGTRVFAHDGSAADLVPHQPRIVLPDETVQFGERYFTVVT